MNTTNAFEGQLLHSGWGELFQTLEHIPRSGAPDEPMIKLKLEGTMKLREPDGRLVMGDVTQADSNNFCGPSGFWRFHICGLRVAYEWIGQWTPMADGKVVTFGVTHTSIWRHAGGAVYLLKPDGSAAAYYRAGLEIGEEEIMDVDVLKDLLDYASSRKAMPV